MLCGSVERFLPAPLGFMEGFCNFPWKQHTFKNKRQLSREMSRTCHTYPFALSMSWNEFAAYLCTRKSWLTWSRLSDYSVQFNKFQKHVSSPWVTHMLFNCLCTVKKCCMTSMQNKTVLTERASRSGCLLLNWPPNLAPIPADVLNSSWSSWWSLSNSGRDVSLEDFVSRPFIML